VSARWLSVALFALLASGCAEVAPKRVARVEPVLYAGWGTYHYVESTDGYWCYTTGYAPKVGSLLANCSWLKGNVTALPAEKP
jgi:hypothetical protein